jgi:hypothetical protein
MHDSGVLAVADRLLRSAGRFAAGERRPDRVQHRGLVLSVSAADEDDVPLGTTQSRPHVGIRCLPGCGPSLGA